MIYHLLKAYFPNILLFPFVFLKEEMEAIFAGKHVIRSTIRAALTFSGLVSGVFVYGQSAIAANFLNSITAALNMTGSTQGMMSLFLSVLGCGSITGFLARIATKAFCYYRFGDPDFYLTKKREQELEEIFKGQGYSISGAAVRKVIDFCIANFRKPLLMEFGTHPHDWKRVLDALIYEGDLEVFLEHYELLQKKLQKLSKKREALEKHGPEIDLSNVLCWSFRNQTRIDSNEQEPLLSRQISLIEALPMSPGVLSLTSFSKEVREKMLAIKALTKFRKTHNNGYTKEELIYFCSLNLKKREQCLTAMLFPVQLSPESTLSSQSSTPPSSNSNQAATYEQDTTNFSYNTCTSSTTLLQQPKLTH